MKKATPGRISAHNQKLILELARKKGPLSRADIVRETGISFPSVSANVRSLLEKGGLLETGAGENAVGRKSTLLAFNAKKGYVLGVDLGRYRIRMAIADLAGEAVAEIESEPHAGTQPLRQADALLLRMLEQSAIPPGEICAACVGVPGVVDRETREIRLAPFMEALSEPQIQHVFQNRLGDIPVHIENSVNCGAIGEKWKGAGQGYREILYVDYGIGIGMALIMNGLLMRGSRDAAGETGFMVLERNGIRGTFSEAGAAEEMVSDHAVEEATGKDLRGLIASHRNGDPNAEEAIGRVIDYFGMMLVNTAAVTNPAIVIISGGVGLELFDFAKGRWSRMLEAHVPYAPTVARSELRGKANVLGAVAMSLRQSDMLSGAEQLF